MASKLKHILIIEDECNGLTQHFLGAPLHSIGRDPKCDIHLTCQFVSRRQATLVKITNEDGTYIYRIVDGIPKGKASSNGMLVNGCRTLACDLQDEDEIRFGPKIRLIYRLQEVDHHSLFEDTLIPTKEISSDVTIGYYRKPGEKVLSPSVDQQLEIVG